MIVAPGKIAVSPLEEVLQDDGFVLPDALKANEGIVVQVGRPQADLYSWWDILWWGLLRKHPCPFKKGMKVPIPRRPIEVNGLVILWQHEITYAEGQNTAP